MRGAQTSRPRRERARSKMRTNKCTACTRETGGTHACGNKSPPKEDVGLGVGGGWRGAPVRATAGLGGRGSCHETVICDLAPRPGWWAVRYTSVDPVGGWVSHGVTDDLTARIVSYRRANSGCE